jgi:hypothetical protein
VPRRTTRSLSISSNRRSSASQCTTPRSRGTGPRTAGRGGPSHRARGSSRASRPSGVRHRVASRGPVGELAVQLGMGHDARCHSPSCDTSLAGVLLAISCILGWRGIKVGGRRARWIVGPITGAMRDTAAICTADNSESDGSAHSSHLVATLTSRLLLDLVQIAQETLVRLGGVNQGTGLADQPKEVRIICAISNVASLHSRWRPVPSAFTTHTALWARPGYGPLARYSLNNRSKVKM